MFSVGKKRKDPSGMANACQRGIASITQEKGGEFP
jgi:hypothetical protein